MKDKLYQDVNDSELLMLYQENDEIAKNILFAKYRFIIECIIRKYRLIWKGLGLDYQELFSEATVGFSDGLNSYTDDKNARLSSFLSLCVERRIQSLLRKHTRINKLNSYSLDCMLDNVLGNEKLTLKDVLSDDWENDPLRNMAEEEDYNNLFKVIEGRLTSREKETFGLLIKGFNNKEISKCLGINLKQVDNSIQRIKCKVRKILIVPKE